MVVKRLKGYFVYFACGQDQVMGLRSKVTQMIQNARSIYDKHTEEVNQLSEDVENALATGE